MHNGRSTQHGIDPSLTPVASSHAASALVEVAATSKGARNAANGGAFARSGLAQRLLDALVQGAKQLQARRASPKADPQPVAKATGDVGWTDHP